MAAVRSTGLTEWSRFDVPGMWSLLRNVSTVEAFRQAGAWQSTYEAAQSLARRLEWYRDGLAGKWSPDRSEAAAMYLGRLDELIGSAQQLADVSVANRQALVTLANAVDEARPKLQRVYEESEAMRQLGAQAKAGASVVRRQQQLHTQATEIMESLGSAAMDSWRHYATADDYQPPRPPTKGGNSVITDSDSASSAGQVAPSSTGRMRRQVGMNADGVPEPVRPQTGSLHSESPSLASSAMDRQAVVHEPGSNSLADSLPAVRVASDAPFAEAGIIRPYNDNETEMKSLAGRPMRSGGVLRSVYPGAEREDIIGTEKSGQFDQDIASRSRPVNPLGGVISGEGRSGLGIAGLGGGNAPCSRSEYRRRAEYDVDHPWHVAEGVSPVLSPGPEPGRFEPGPGVIGIDR